MEEKKQPTLPGYAAMLKGYVNVDPYECVLCQSRLVFNGYRAGTRAITEVKKSQFAPVYVQ
jgi:hypothetical protein